MHSKCAGKDTIEDIEIDLKIKYSTKIGIINWKNVLITHYFVILKPISTLKFAPKTRKFWKLRKKKEDHSIWNDESSCQYWNLYNKTQLMKLSNIEL